jgi:transcriptional regulator with XRE-family HTH domain
MATLERTLTQLIEALGASLGLSRSDLAQAVGVTSRSIDRWLSGDAFPQREARDRLASLESLAERLHETFTTEDAARAWLHDATRYLGGLTPADALRAGRLDRVEAALEALDSGIFV